MNTLSRPRKTFVDYAAVAVCPALIMLLVGSLIFFLVAIGYSGSHLRELQWTFFWFVLAMVLVSRIAIERSSEHAGIYGLCLAAATGFMLTRYIEFAPGAWALLALIWWATNKLTWDSTVIEDEQDASGEGLLQAAKLEPANPSNRVAPAALASAPVTPGRNAAVQKLPAKGSPQRGRAKSAPGKQPRAPGRWVIYFSLGALPIFGFGPGLLPQPDLAARRYVFYLVALYFAAGLGLLLITSFLGLRRYLRQRYLQMPAAMAATWLTTGTAIVLVLLAGCVLLPRPNAHWSITAMVERLGDPPKQKPGKSSRTQDPSSTAQKPSEDQKPGEENPSHAEPDKSSQGAPTAGQANAPTSVAATAPSAQSLRKLLRLLIRIALIGLVAVVVIRNWAFIRRVLLEFWRALCRFWSGLFPRKEKPDAAAKQSAPTRAARPGWAALKNPFASGAAAAMSLEELIVASFQGLEAWAQQHQCGREPDQTPFEFADRLAAEVPDLAYEAQQLARLYAQVAYAKTAELPASRTMLEILWSKMTGS